MGDPDVLDSIGSLSESFTIDPSVWRHMDSTSSFWTERYGSFVDRVARTPHATTTLRDGISVNNLRSVRVSTDLAGAREFLEAMQDRLGLSETTITRGRIFAKLILPVETSTREEALASPELLRLTAVQRGEKLVEDVQNLLALAAPGTVSRLYLLDGGITTAFRRNKSPVIFFVFKDVPQARQVLEAARALFNAPTPAPIKDGTAPGGRQYLCFRLFLQV
jgi:hypothetical protein